MTVDKFVNEYKKINDDDRIILIGKIINTDYIPYATKVADCKNIVNNTSYTNTKPNMFKINSPARKMLYELTLVNRYTELEIDFTNAIEMYDLLDECGALQHILFLISERETNKYKELLDMTISDFQENERSMIGYLDTKFASLKIFGEEFNKIIETVSV